MLDFEKDQISIKFGEYHRFPLTFDNLNIQEILVNLYDWQAPCAYV